MLKIKKINFSLSKIILSFLFISFCLISPNSHSIKKSSVLDIKEDDFVLGDKNAPVIIIEYASLSCSHCADFHHTTLPKIIKEYIDTGKAKLVFRHFPFNYPALIGSMLLQCIDNNIRYDYLSALFKLQAKWVKQDVESTKNELYKIMQIGGMSKDQFNNCINDKKLENKILEGLINAQNEFQIQSTPSFIINGNLLVGNKPIKDFREIIDKILASI